MVEGVSSFLWGFNFKQRVLISIIEFEYII